MTDTPNLDKLDESLATADDAIHDAQASAAAIRELVEDLEPDAKALLGCSMSKWDHKTSALPLARCYGRDDVQIAADDYGASVLIYNMGQSASAKSIGDECAWVMSEYGHAVVGVIMCKGNEVDRDDHLGGNQAGIDAWIEQAPAVADAIHATPGCYHGINVTGYGIRSTGNAAKFKPAAPTLDVFVPNTYPPGRTKKPPVFTPYPDFIDECLDMAVDWGVGALAVGEMGIPVSPSDPDKRPEYMAGAARYLADGCASRGLVFVGASYWDSVKLKSGQPDPNEPDNRFLNDGTATSSAWYGALG